MAALRFYRIGFLLLLFDLTSFAVLEKRFSDFKRCADEECSMLLCRGKAVEDFTGPDCRFLSFKKSETIYVYYKLSGRRGDLLAGSVGSNFGYFPKDLLAVNHLYTDKEIEVPAEETDFVCFDTGYDKFNNYDVDLLLSFSQEQNEGEDKETYDQSQTADGAQIETSVNEETDSEKETEHHDNSEDFDEVPDDESASLPEFEPYVETESSSSNVEEPETETTFDATDRSTEDTDTFVGSILENIVSERSETKNAPTEPSSEKETELVSSFEGVQMPELKTTLGSTFDAVTTTEDITKNVTPYEEEESDPMESPPDSDIDVTEEIPLLSFSGKTVNTPASDELEEDESPPTTHEDDKPEIAEEKNMWTSLGDAVFSVVTGGELTAYDLSSSEEDEDEDIVEDEAVSKPSPSIEQVKDIEELAAVELSQEPDNVDPVVEDPSSSSASPDNQESNSDFDSDDESEGEVIRPEDDWEEILEPGELSEDPISQDDTSALPEAQKSDLEIANEDVENGEEMSKDSGVDNDEEDIHDTSYAMEHNRDLARDLGENKIWTDEKEIVGAETERFQALYTEDMQSDNSDVRVDKESQVDGDNAAKQGSNVALERGEDLADELTENKTVTPQEELVTPDAESHHDPSMEDRLSEDLNLKSINNQKTVDARLPRQTVEDSLPSKLYDRLMAGSKINISQPEFPTVEPNTPEELLPEEIEDEKEERNEELLEDENALSFPQTKNVDFDKPLIESSPEPEYSDSVLRLTLLREHFTEERIERIQNILGLKNLFKVEALFSDLDTELQATRRSHTGTTQDIETSLESILEASENTILDEIEKMLDSQATKHNDDQLVAGGAVDEETEILDDFQELAFSLRQKYSTASDSTPLATGKGLDMDQDEHEVNVKDDTPHIVEEDKVEIIPEAEMDDNFTVTDQEKMRAENKKEQLVLDEALREPDLSVEEDGGHFNKNKDNQPSFSASEEMQKVSQANMQNPLDVDLDVVVQGSSSDSVEMNEEKVGLLSTGIMYMAGIFFMSRKKMAEWAVAMISLLPEEWKPGETLFGCPWPAVVITTLVGVVTFTLFFWRTVLAVKKREYLVDQKRLADQIQALKQAKNDALTKLTKLEKRTEQLKEDQKQSKQKVSSTMKRIQDMESKLFEAQTLNENIMEENHKYAKQLEEERESSLKTLTRIEKLERSKEKLQLSRDKIQQTLSQTSILLDEAKIREDARSVQHKCLQKDYTVLKEENNKLKVTIKDWEHKHEELNKQIKIYQKSQKELEESVMLKDHNLEVMSDLLADLEACDSQKDGTSVLANGELEPDKKTAMKNRIKQMMDFSRVQATLCVVEEERDRFMTKLLNEEKVRKSLEGQHQELEHAIATLKSEKGHVENQFKMLQQKNEIMVEMYQQKESALQQRLTKEEMERRSKETMLSEAGGKALEAEEQVKGLRKRITEMEEQMKQTEDVYKEQIKEQENKTHSNWINARNAERALNQEKFESSKLKDKLAVLTSQLNERRAPLFRPNSGQPTGPRQGDSYGPSPVSGGAPSPPMIDGQRRPPSAPVGPRIDPYYGPRPPSDPHGRYGENKHNPGLDMMGPRNSSPSNMDGLTQAVDPQVKAETQAEVSTDSPEPGPGSFLASPIRDSPGPLVHGPPPGPVPYEQLPPLGRLPPPGPYRPPRPGPYNLPPGPHGPPIPPNGPMGDFSFRPTNGHEFLPRPGYGHPAEAWGPPPQQFRPPPPHLFGPGIRGPNAPIPTDMRFHGPREHHRPPMNLPPGVPPNTNPFVQAPPGTPQNSARPPCDPTQASLSKQESAQNSARPETTKP